MSPGDAGRGAGAARLESKELGSAFAAGFQGDV